MNVQTVLLVCYSPMVNWPVPLYSCLPLDSVLEDVTYLLAMPLDMLLLTGRKVLSWHAGDWNSPPLIGTHGSASG